jgi:rSAM/selenodomain-associated transferase 2
LQITIIVPTLQEAQHLMKLLPWLKEQGGTLVQEIIVVDAQSTDQTVEVARSLGAKVIVSDQRNRAHQMNLGADAAQTELLYFVHADTIPPQQFAQTIIQYLDKPGKMGCFRYHFRSESRILRFNAWFTRFHFLWCQGGDKTFFIRKSCFEELGGYRPFYSIMEEYDFLRRAVKTHKLQVLPQEVSVSARKYEGRSWLRVQIANILVFNGWRLGVHPDRLRVWYRKLLN